MVSGSHRFCLMVVKFVSHVFHLWIFLLIAPFPDHRLIVLVSPSNAYNYLTDHLITGSLLRKYEPVYNKWFPHTIHIHTHTNKPLPFTLVGIIIMTSAFLGKSPTKFR